MLVSIGSSVYNLAHATKIHRCEDGSVIVWSAVSPDGGLQPVTDVKDGVAEALWSCLDRAAPDATA